ncbi:hypothetical protein [Streptomyces sp. NPDC093260]|uniref:hypothetical protein n=1 Tax=Streptomyces sp. NPDC093260 TaxID=3155073 RepID=UPI00341B4345
MAVGSKPADLVSTPAEKRAAAHAIAKDIEPGTRGAGRWADEETGAAVRSFGARDGDGWLTSAALHRAHRTWTDQVRNLMDRLGAEKEALGSDRRVLTSADLAVGSALRESAALRTPVVGAGVPGAGVGAGAGGATEPSGPTVPRPASALDGY